MINSRVYVRTINIEQLLQDYQDGKYVNITDPIPFPDDILEESGSSQLMTHHEPIKNQPYEITFGSGSNFACIGHRVVNQEGRFDRYLPVGDYRCMNCIRKITSQPWGIPVKRTQQGDRFIYSTIDLFCSPQCTLREIHNRKQNTLYSRSLDYFSELYENWTGQKFKDLKPASDPRLLKILNGPLSWEQYHKMTRVYSEKPSNIYMFPVIEYLEQDA